MITKLGAKHSCLSCLPTGAFRSVCAYGLILWLKILDTVRCPQVNSKELAWSAAAHGPPQLDHRDTYKLQEGGYASMGPTVSPTALSKFLTAVSGKQFQNPPSEMLTSRGVAMHDLLELFSGRPVPGRVCLLCSAFQQPELLPLHIHQCLPGLCG